MGCLGTGLSSAPIAAALLVALVTAAGCAAMQVMGSQPVPQDRLEPIGFKRISRGGYRLDALPVSEDAADLIVLVPFSGAGKRSAPFGYGALKGMRETMIETQRGPQSLLSQVDAISGVSGASFAVPYYGLYRKSGFIQARQSPAKLHKVC